MEVTPGSKEVLSGTDAEISCTVTGITTTLQSVRWENSNSVDVTNLPDYTVTEGQFDGGGQVTTLTVAKEQATADATYFCIITSSSPADTIEIYAAVNLDVFSEFW